MVEIARRSIPRDFRFIDTTTARVLLVEGTDRVLPSYPPDLSEKALRQLQDLGVDVRTGTLVTDIAADRVTVRVGGPDGDEEVIPAGNVYWAAGVAASPLARCLGAPLDRAGRVIVEPDCSLPGHPEVFVVGDLARIEQDGDVLPGVAQVAIQSGRHAGRTIRDDIRRRPRQPFRYFFWGNLATIGRAAAVADFGRVRFGGTFAWLVWVFVHILKLVGFRNRILVMVQWAWAWLTYQRGIRLITGSPEVELEKSRSGRDT
jgi:NADH dehydrogenase